MLLTLPQNPCPFQHSAFLLTLCLNKAPSAGQSTSQMVAVRYPQELEALKTSGGGVAAEAAAAAKLAAAASPKGGRTSTEFPAQWLRRSDEFSPQGRVVQLADLPAGALPMTDAAPPITAADASAKTASESGRSAQVGCSSSFFPAHLGTLDHASARAALKLWPHRTSCCRPVYVKDVRCPNLLFHGVKLLVSAVTGRRHHRRNSTRPRRDACSGARREQPLCHGLNLAAGRQPEARRPGGFAVRCLALGLHRQPGRRRGRALCLQRARRPQDHQPRHAVCELLPILPTKV